MAVSDGHGSKEYDRSDEGSRFACEVGVAALQNLATRVRVGERVDLTLFNKWIVAQWQTRTLLRDMEYNQREDLDYTAEEVILPTWRRYGATLLLLLVMGEDLWAFQIGDGAIVLGLEHGSLMPFSSEVKYGSGTNSLCLDNARSLIKSRHIVVPDLRWACAMTDGMSDSHPDDLEEVFGVTVPDYFEQQYATNPNPWTSLVQWMGVQCHNHAWCDGDDTTIAFAFTTTTTNTP